jgi:hypothetical protein
MGRASCRDREGTVCSAVINGALTESYTQHKRGLALLRERAEHADEDRVARMRAHIDAQAASLGLSDDE